MRFPGRLPLRCRAANSARTGGSPACGPTSGAPLTRRKRLPFHAAPEVAGHQDLVIVGDRDRSEIECLVVQRAEGETVLDHVRATVRVRFSRAGLDPDA